MFTSNNTMPNHRPTTPSSSSGSEMSSSSDCPRPHFYIVRPDKTFVPLIALDEISPTVRIHGVPSSLTADNIEKWNMARCGDQIDRPQKYYRIEFPTNERSHRSDYAHGSSESEGGNRLSMQPDGHLDAYSNSEAPAQHGYHTPPKHQRSQESVNDSATCTVNHPLGQRGGHITDNMNYGQAQRPIAESHGEAQDAFDHMVKENTWAKEQHSSRTKNAATPGVYGKKKFCTYWIRTGNCDYVQEGCKYLHVIPDEETRLRIGIRDMPRWAKEDIPAPQHGFHEKQHPAMSQDWRRQEPRTGQANELPETLCTRTPPALYPNMATTTRANTSSSSFTFPAQHLPTPADHMAQQNPIMHHSPFNSVSSAPFKSAPSSTPEPYQRQIQSVISASQPIPPTPTSAVHRYSPPTQPPISRPVNGVHRAPDKMPEDVQAYTQGQAQQQVDPVSTLTKVDSKNDNPPMPAGIGQANAFLDSHPVLSPLPAGFGNFSLNSRGNTPIVNGINGSAPTRTNTPNLRPHAVFGNQTITGRDGDQHYGQMDVNMSTYHAQSPRLFGGVTAGRDINQTGSSKNEAVKRMVNGHITGSVKGTSKSHITGDRSNGQINANPNGNIQSVSPKNVTPSLKPPVVMHRRHFVAPGEPEYVATPVESEKVPAKKNGNGVQKKRLRGRGGNHADLIEA
ncbi:MAG: hypothetical protein Q9217_000771 [Psora testacea]